jgi:hypothetical protein
VYQPGAAYLANGGSELGGGAEVKGSDEPFTGAHPTRGVNPANGIVVYYHLPELGRDDELTLTIEDADGRPVRTFSSKAVEGFKKWDGGPNAEPLLPKNAGLNRFVWNMRYPTIAGVPGVYIEGSHNGHKAVPGRYRFTFKSGARTATTNGEILPNPLYQIEPAQYLEYHEVMSSMEREVTAMHETVNRLNDKRTQLESLLPTLPAGEEFAAVKRDGEALVKKLKAWDEDMVSRRSRAYDDVDNYAQKLTSNYLFLINQTESDLPRVNQSSLDRRKEIRAAWKALEARADEMAEKELPALNRRLWDLGIGAIWKN